MQRLRWTLPLALLCLSSCCLSATQLPHILFIVVDDHGWHDCSYTGSRVNTPTIDALRSEGIALNNYYVQKVCSPTRAALMTGRYPHRYGLQFPFCGGDAMALNANETLLPQYLKTVGYTTRAVGKWHLGFTNWKFTPTFRGFESFFGYYNCAEDYFFHGLRVKENSTFVDSLDFHSDDQPNCGANCSRPVFEAVGEDWEHYSTTLFSEQIIDIVKQHDPARPLFLYFASQDTHNPGQVPECYETPYEDTIPDPLRRKLAGKLSTVDSAIANITQAYKENGLYDNLLVIYTSDNGGPITVQSGPNTGKIEDAIGSSNYPLRGGKHNAYEGGVRGTAFVSGPALKQLAPNAPAEYDGLMHVVDWVPTLCSLVGCNATPFTPSLKLDGVDQWPSLTTNGSAPRDEVIIDIEQPVNRSGWPETIGAGVVRKGKYKLHIGDCGQFDRPGDWSNPQAWLNVTASEPSTYTGYMYQLFDVESDPSERHDLINNTALADVVLDLLAIYERERAVAHYPQSLGPPGEPVYVQDSNPLSQTMPVWLPWLDDDAHDAHDDEALAAVHV
eukprot:m.51405 g.51405  ORF g.51405 m.51405 type:complete len:558 (+) comp12622_c0_seq1:78-1751(+)